MVTKRFVLCSVSQIAHQLGAGLKFVSNKLWTEAAEGKTLLTLEHSLNAFSELRVGRTLKLVEASKS